MHPNDFIFLPFWSMIHIKYISSIFFIIYFFMKFNNRKLKRAHLTPPLLPPYHLHLQNLIHYSLLIFHPNYSHHRLPLSPITVIHHPHRLPSPSIFLSYHARFIFENPLHLLLLISCSTTTIIATFTTNHYSHHLSFLPPPPPPPPGEYKFRSQNPYMFLSHNNS